MFTIIVFIIVLSILVLVHELGHFVMAKRAGMKVEEFGFGFPPRIFGIQKGETTYTINWIPFGGFVKILGEDDNENKDSRSFAAGKTWTRIGVIVAGVLMNVVLAFVLLAISNFLGPRIGFEDRLTALSAKAEDVKVQIIQIVPKSPAEAGQLKLLDEILYLKKDGTTTEVKDIPDVQTYVSEHLDSEFVMGVKRDNMLQEIKVTPRSNPPEGQGALGIQMAITGVVHYPWYISIKEAGKGTKDQIKTTVGGFVTVIKNLFKTGKAGVELAGPVGIAVFTGKAARFGFGYLLQFMAFMSINLAVLNILPFPALDGGRLFFIIIEKIKGSPVSKRIEATVNSVGFVLLLALMVYVTTKDIIKFF